MERAGEEGRESEETAFWRYMNKRSHLSNGVSMQPITHLKGGYRENQKQSSRFRMCALMSMNYGSGEIPRARVFLQRRLQAEARAEQLREEIPHASTTGLLPRARRFILRRLHRRRVELRRAYREAVQREQTAGTATPDSAAKEGGGRSPEAGCRKTATHTPTSGIVGASDDTD